MPHRYSTLKALLGLLLILPLQSCFVLGISTNVQWADDKTFKKRYRQMGIAHEQPLYLDTAFNTRIRHLYKANQSAQHDHLQPVQYLLFDHQGYLRSFMINCDVHLTFPFRPHWNYEHRFDTFPTTTMIPTDSLLTLSVLNGHIKDLSGQPIPLDAANADYTEVVIFSRALHRVSRRLIQQVRRQDKKGRNVKTYYVYGDNNLMWGMADSATRIKIAQLPNVKW